MPKGEVGDEVIVHHIDVGKIGVVNPRQIVGHVGEIRAEDTGVDSNSHWRQAIAFVESTE